jgi:hypothetical protein
MAWTLMFSTPFAIAVQVLLERVHAAVGEETREVDGPPFGLDAGEAVGEGGHPGHLAVARGFGDADDVLVDHPPRPDVEMPHLGVPHLPLRQTDRQPGGFERRPRHLAEEAVEARLLGLRDRVVLAIRAAAEAVQDDEDEERALAQGAGKYQKATSGLPVFPA